MEDTYDNLPGEEAENAVVNAVKEVVALKERAEKYLNAAEKEKNPLLQLSWFREVKSCLELLAKVKITEIKIIAEKHKNVIEAENFSMPVIMQRYLERRKNEAK